MIGVLILIAVGLLILASAIRLVWRVSRGDLQIEPTSYGRQFFGRIDKGRDKPE